MISCVKVFVREGRYTPTMSDIKLLFETKMELQCGCVVETWKFLTLLAFAILDHQQFKCPHHQCIIETDSLLRETAIDFVDYMSSEEGLERFPFFFRPILHF